MRIKKFTCNSCGAPKVNEYRSPYIMCDYCGSFTDIDYTLGLDFWKESPDKTQMYALKKIEYMQKIQESLAKKDREEYYRLQREYWDFYYTTYPEYLPPSVSSGDKYSVYLDVCASSSTNYGFDVSWKEKENELNRLQRSITYYSTQQGNKAGSESFFKMAEYYINMTKEGFKDFYENPDYSVMHELLPPSVHLKMKLSMFVQVWLPYLTANDAERFLKMTGFTQQYIELQKPEGRDGDCIHCGSKVYIPKGAYRIYCEECRKTMPVEQKFACMSCGAENSVPENPSKPVDCEYCGTENRLIQALFG